MDSILSSIKLLLGAAEADTHFDEPIIMHINSQLSILNQLGVGPPKGFRISGKESTWGEFIGDDLRLADVVQFVYIQVKLVFDPPASSAVIASLERTASELQWRLQVAAETKDPE